MISARTFFRRFGGLLHKEFVQIVRDPSSIAIALVMPVVLLLLIGFGISLDARNVRFGIVDENRSVESAGLFQAFANTPYFRPFSFLSSRAAEAAEEGAGRNHAAAAPSRSASCSRIRPTKASSSVGSGSSAVTNRCFIASGLPEAIIRPA